MKTAIIQADTGTLLTLDPLTPTATPLQDAGMEVLTPDWQSPPDEAATRDFGDLNIVFKVINVLIVGDGDNELIPRLAELEPKGYIPLPHRVENQEDFLAALESRAWDVVISDHVLPQFSGPEALKLLRTQGCDTPFIMLSGVFGEEKAATMMRAGANDYVLKQNLARLVPVLERELKAATDRQRHQSAERVIRHLVADNCELQNVVERAMTLCGDKVTPGLEQPGRHRNNSDPVTAATAPLSLHTAPNVAGIAGEFFTLRELEKRHIFAALDRCHDNRNHAAKLLDVSTRTLRNKLHEYDGTSSKAASDKALKP